MSLLTSGVLEHKWRASLVLNLILTTNTKATKIKSELLNYVCGKGVSMS